MDYIIQNNIHTYRNSIPLLEVPIVIVALVHQGKDMLDYIIKNIDKFVVGHKLLVIHINIKEPIDENTLPEWVWIVRTLIETDKESRKQANAVVECLKFSVEHFKFINILHYSAGSVFIKKFTPPSDEIVRQLNNESYINPDKKALHEEPVHISKKGGIAKYLTTHNHFPWQYKGCDKDLEFHSLIENRNFSFFKGCAWPGQMYPYNAAKMMVEDLPKLYNKPNGDYICPEVYFSTYAFNYALQNNIKLDIAILLTNWDKYYNIEHIEYIEHILQYNFKDIYMVSKVPDNIHHPVRTFINNILGA